MSGKESSLAKDSQTFYHLLAEFVRLYQYRDRSCICYHDISITQCYAIHALIRSGPLTLNDLSDELHLDKSTASRVIDALTRKGYVVKKKDKTDGRAVHLQVTAKGRTLHEKIEIELINEQQRLLSGFTSPERKTAVKLINALVKATKARFDELKQGDPLCKLAG